MPTTSRTDLQHWSTLLRRLGLSLDPVATHAALLAAYAEPGRAYHTRRHLEEGLTLLDELEAHAAEPDEVCFAFWLHDAVYDSRARDSEARSARWAGRWLREGGAPEDRVRRVEALVLATAHEAEPDPGDPALLVDVDLAILGATPERFDAYEDEVRQEYAWVPEPEFRAARARVLRVFLERSPLFRTEVLRARFEEAARRNLARSLARCDS